MSAQYPDAVYTPRTMANRVGVTYDANKTKVIYAEDINKDRDEIVAIEDTLGLNPNGDDADVVARLDRLERKLPRIGTVTDSATPAPNCDNQDMFTITALAQNATISAPSGTPVNGQKLIIRILDAGASKTLGWNSIYRAGSDIALPTATVISKTLYCGFIYNSAASKWDLIAVTNNI